MARYTQCVLRKGDQYLSALWIEPRRAVAGAVLDVQLTNPQTGAWGPWQAGWTVDAVWTTRMFPPPRPDWPADQPNCKVRPSSG